MQSNQLKISKYIPNFENEIRSLLENSYLELGAQLNWSFTQLEAHLNNCWVLLKDDQVIGVLGGIDLTQDFEILVFVINKNWRGLGFSQYFFAEWTKLNAFQNIFLEVHEENTRAQNFYRALGFKNTGKRPNYYKDGCAALCLLWSRS